MLSALESVSVARQFRQYIVSTCPNARFMTCLRRHRAAPQVEQVVAQPGTAWQSGVVVMNSMVADGCIQQWTGASRLMNFHKGYCAATLPDPGNAH